MIPAHLQSSAARLYPFASHFLDRQGIRYHYLDEGPGDGPVVVMLHGNPTWSFYYRNVVLALRQRYRCVVPDHIGCGLSDQPPEARYRYNLAHRVADLTALIEHLGLKKFHLVVHDWGGMIGSAYAVEHPEQIASLTLLNTGGFRLPPGKSLPWELRLCRLPVLGELLVRGANAFCEGAVRRCVTRTRLDPAVAQLLLAPYDSWAHRVAVWRFVQDIPLNPGDESYDLVAATEAKLPSLADKPALIAWGMRDFVFDGAFLARWQELLPQAQVHRFADAGHYVLEDAGAQVIPLIEQFLDAQPRAQRP